MTRLLLWLLAASLVIAAPLPRDKPRPPLPSLQTMRIGQAEYRVAFGPGGEYQGGTTDLALWQGRWRLDGDVLLIEEWRVGEVGLGEPRWVIRATLEPGQWKGRAVVNDGTAQVFGLR
jgi:hypothetical protein